MLKIYNSLSKQKETFKPIKEGEINLYVCGMTVYDYCHLGHGRVLVAFDVITRYLKARGYKVNYIRNITDIDDKIIKRANENQEAFDALTERFIDAMDEDVSRLGVLLPDKEPRATAYIAEIIAMIEKLLEKKLAYIAKNGDVYFHVSQFKNYGKLAHKDIEGLKAGARVDVTDAKEEPLDFVLWKMAKPDEPKWNSPWGEGRPGWHIECSAMSTHCLGDHFDIHGGGFDLQFPHHENEIAQTEGATGKTFVNTWMHVGYLQINKEKMSKSAGNFFTIRDILKTYPAEVVRYFLLSSHYRKPLNYSTENLQIAFSALQRFYYALRKVKPTEGLSIDEAYHQRFIDVMDDDFNTPEALAVMFDCVREMNRVEKDDPKRASELSATVKALGAVLGILHQSPEDFLHRGTPEEEVIKIDSLIVERQKAREEKNWNVADKIRDELVELNVVVEDHVDGTTWRKKS